MSIIKTIIRRVIISAIREGQIKRFDAAGVAGEQFLDREFIQQYGLTSRPLADSEGIVIGAGNVFYLIGTDDRRYRLAIENGEVALYTDEGDKIHLKRGNIIEISGQSKVIVTSPAVELGDGTLRKLIDERFQAKFEAHKHPLVGVQAGAATLLTGVPDNAPLTLADIATTNTTAS